MPPDRYNEPPVYPDDEWLLSPRMTSTIRIGLPYCRTCTHPFTVVGFGSAQSIPATEFTVELVHNCSMATKDRP